MLIEKEVIGPGTHWYTDLKTGLPRKYTVKPADTARWCEQGNKMLSLGLTVPIPCEHDFEATPLTPADKLKSNAGWVTEYKLGTPNEDGTRATDDRLFAVTDIQDETIAGKLGKTIKWTSPYFASFVDGKGNKWNNVIAHLALTGRPRVVDQAPFKSVSAAMAFAVTAPEDTLPEAFALTSAGRLKLIDGHLVPEFPVAFSLCSGVAFSEEDAEEPKEKEKKPKDFLDEEVEDDMDMGELLRDLLRILGVNMPQTATDAEFKRALYESAMLKIKELSAKPPAAPHPVPPGKKPNPVMQEQQPMYMSLEDINKLEDGQTKQIALSMYNENVRATEKTAALEKQLNSLRDAELKREAERRAARVAALSKKSPKVKVDLEAMLVKPEMALSMGEAGAVVDPMAFTLGMLEKGLAEVPSLHTVVTAEVPQPTDASTMTIEQEDELADSLARGMGCAPQKKAG